MAIVLSPELQSAVAPVTQPVAPAEDILAGQPPSGVGANPVPPIGSQPVSPIETPLSGQPEGVTGPAPARLEEMPAPAAGSFADKLKTALATAHAVMSGLSIAGNVGKAPAGSGVLYGMSKAGQAWAEQDAAAQARTDKLKQQEVENKRAAATQDLEKQKFNLYTAEANARMANEQRVLHQTDQANIEKSISSGKALVDRMKNAPVPGVALKSDISTDELRRRQMAGEFQDGAETAYPTGKIFTGKTDPKTGEPEWETSWTVMMLPKSYNLTKEDIETIKDLPQFKGENGKPDESKIPTQMSGAQFNSLYQDSSDMVTAKAARNDALTKANIMTQEDAEKLEWKDLGPQWMNALANNGNNQFKAAAALMGNKQFVAGHPHFLDEVQQNYGGAKAWSEEYNAWQKNEVEAAKVAAENAAKNSFLGDPSKVGNPAAFLASLKPAEKADIIAAGQGRLPIIRWDYLISKQPNFVNALMAAFPNFDGNKIQQYLSNLKDYTAAGATGKALNSAATAMRDLKSLYDNETYWAHFNPASDVAVKLDQDVNKVAAEIAKANKGGGGSPTEDEIKDVAKALMPKIGSRRAAAQEQLRNMMHKVNETQDQWEKNIPSPAYYNPMPGISADAKVSASYVLNDGKFVVRDPSGKQYFPKDYDSAVKLQQNFDAIEIKEKRGQ